MKIIDSTKSIFLSASHFLSGTMISRMTGLCRDIAIAFAFGTHSALAAFMVAFRFAHLMRRLLGEGALQTSFIPQFEDLKNDNPLRACRFFSNLYGLIVLLLVFLIPFSIATLFGLIKFGDFSPGNREIIKLTIVMLPSLFFICLYGLNASLLQCEKIYFTPSVAPAFFNIIWILGVLFVRNWQEDSAMVFLGVFIIIASAGQWFATVPATYKALKQHGHGKPWKGVNFKDKDLWRLAAPLALGVLGIAASQINNFLDAIFARYASEEGPAYLWYAARAQQLPLALFAVSLSGALLPPLSRAIKEGQIEKFCDFLGTALNKTMMLMIPITFMILILGDTSVNLVYGRGHFTTESTVITSQCFWAYGLGLLPMSLVLILAPAFYAQNKYKITTAASMIAMLLNLVLNTIFVMGMGYGAFSVAFATSVSSWLNFLVLYFCLLRSFASVPVLPLAAHAIKLAFAGLIGCFLVLALDSWVFNGNTAIAILTGNTPLYPREFFLQLIRFLSETSVFLGGTGLVVVLLEKLQRKWTKDTKAHWAQPFSLEK